MVTLEQIWDKNPKILAMKHQILPKENGFETHVRTTYLHCCLLATFTSCNNWLISATLSILRWFVERLFAVNQTQQQVTSLELDSRQCFVQHGIHQEHNHTLVLATRHKHTIRHTQTRGTTTAHYPVTRSGCACRHAAAAVLSTWFQNWAWSNVSSQRRSRSISSMASAHWGLSRSTHA